MNTPNELTATQARHLAKRIKAECSECFTTVKAVKLWGQWQVDIDGGQARCYGRTIKTEEGALDLISIFNNSKI